MTLPTNVEFLSPFGVTRSESDYDLRSLTSSTSSAAYTYNFDENLIPNPDSINPRATTPVLDYDDTSSDISSPPLSPRNSVNLQDFIFRGGTPPPELRISSESSSSPSRSSIHSGIRSNSDGSTTVPVKLKRSSSTADTPHAVASGSVLTKRSGSESSGSSPTTPHFLRSGSIGESKNVGKVTLALGRSGSGEFTNISTSPSGFSSASPPNTSPIGFEATSPSKEHGSPVLSRNTKRLNIIGIGRSNAESSSSSDSHSPRSRNSLKLFSSLTKSGGEGSPDSTNNNNSSTPNKSLTSSGGCKTQESKGLKFAELQFLNCSNCTSLLDKSLQAIALQKLPLQCLYLGM